MIIGLILLQFLPGVFSDSLLISKSDDADYISMFPRFVEADDVGNIYVAEMAEFAIRKYNDKGNFVRRIGRRGRGPGEFQDITTLYHNNQKIVVIDYISGRGFYFSEDGDLIHESIVNQRNLPWPRQIVSINETLYFLSVSSDSESIVKSVDSNFNVVSEFFSKESIYNDNAIALDYMSMNPGSMTILDDRILFAPYFYTGKIYNFDIKNQSYEVISGRKIVGDSFIVLPKEANSYSIRYGGTYGITKLKLNHESRGIFSHNNNVFHFIQFTDDNRKIFGYELFDSQLKFIKFVPLIVRTIAQGEIIDIPISVKAIDSHGRVIMHNYETATLTAYKLKFN